MPSTVRNTRISCSYTDQEERCSLSTKVTTTRDPLQHFPGGDFGYTKGVRLCVTTYDLLCSRWSIRVAKVPTASFNRWFMSDDRFGRPGQGGRHSHYRLFLCPPPLLQLRRARRPGQQPLSTQIRRGTHHQARRCSSPRGSRNARFRFTMWVLSFFKVGCGAVLSVLPAPARRGISSNASRTGVSSHCRAWLVADLPAQELPSACPAPMPLRRDDAEDPGGRSRSPLYVLVRPSPEQRGISVRSSTLSPPQEGSGSRGGGGEDGGARALVPAGRRRPALARPAALCHPTHRLSRPREARPQRPPGVAISHLVTAAHRESKPSFPPGSAHLPHHVCSHVQPDALCSLLCPLLLPVNSCIRTRTMGSE